LLAPGDEVTHTTQRERKNWLQVVRGAITVDGERLEAGDGAASAYEERIVVASNADSEVLLFDMG
jgi:hypothetical protein